MTYDPEATRPILDEVIEERRRQHDKFGDQSHRADGIRPGAPTVILAAIGDHTGRALAAYSNHGLADRLRARCQSSEINSPHGSTFEEILTEEWGEVLASPSIGALRSELIQVAAVAVQWVEAIDARPVVDLDDGGPR